MTDKVKELTNDHAGDVTYHLTEARISDMFEKKTENGF
jgi:hypothetical protein